MTDNTNRSEEATKLVSAILAQCDGHKMATVMDALLMSVLCMIFNYKDPSDRLKATVIFQSALEKIVNDNTGTQQ